MNRLSFPERKGPLNGIVSTLILSIFSFWVWRVRISGSRTGSHWSSLLYTVYIVESQGFLENPGDAVR
jgi:hypothetical protein